MSLTDAHRHFTTEALSSQLSGIKRFDLGIVEHVPSIIGAVHTILDEAVIVTPVRRAGVDRHADQVVDEGTIVRLLVCLHTTGKTI